MTTQSGSKSWSSRNPPLELALEEALEADLKPSRLPNPSSSLLELDSAIEGVETFVCREGERAYGLLKTGASLAVVEGAVRGALRLGMPLTRREAMTDARLGFEAVGAAAAAVEGVLDRTRDALDVFFWSVDAVDGAGRESEEMEGFLRSCSVEAGVRKADWLPEDLSTGRREGAGLGRPEGRGMDDAGSMASQNAIAGGLALPSDNRERGGYNGSGRKTCPTRNSTAPFWATTMEERPNAGRWVHKASGRWWREGAVAQCDRCLQCFTCTQALLA